ncbi:MAG: hypothetical protein MRK00_07005 [Nitrosomonas sp.]|nr:hypothetical protein [Nitrosomonas sp.]
MKERAVIIGGSISGLLCATILSPLFKKVIIIERDKIFDPVSPRKGTAQSFHAHLLLTRGLQGLENLLPGFIQTLKSKGSVSTKSSEDWQTMFSKGLMFRFKSDLFSLNQSRQMLEQTLREFVMRSYPNLEVLDDATVFDMRLAKHHPPEVIYSRKQQTGVLEADLLVDCSGRNTKTPMYLEKQGFGVVPRRKIYPYIGYSTRIFKNVYLED